MGGHSCPSAPPIELGCHSKWHFLLSSPGPQNPGGFQRGVAAWASLGPISRGGSKGAPGVFTGSAGAAPAVANSPKGPNGEMNRKGRRSQKELPAEPFVTSQPNLQGWRLPGAEPAREGARSEGLPCTGEERAGSRLTPPAGALQGHQWREEPRTGREEKE